MLAKVIRNRGPRKNTRRDFARRVRYSCAKACAVALRNLAGLWPHAALQMEVAARLRKRVRRPCTHIVLSWARGENPSNREVIAAAHRAMAELGARGHGYVIAVHRDSDNIHVHIVLNRVHPLTGKALSLSHDYARLERACRVIEHAFGWPADRGRFQAEVDGDEIRLVPMPPEHSAVKARAPRTWRAAGFAGRARG